MKISQYVISYIECKFIRKCFNRKGINKKGKGIKRAGEGIVRAGEGIVRAGEGYNKMDF